MIKKTHHCYQSRDENQENIRFLSRKNTPSLIGADPFFTTRRGGVSLGACSSFNLGDHVQDHPGDVARNRAALLAALGPGRRLALVNQVHGIRTVEAGWRGATPEADAVVTNRPGVVVGVLTADCAPVLF
ncbi:MAG: laccase domain-containing protein, partial [Magnetococcales bacterium]|nr:laccase domain-containing protein [Magnetococcales bacterium]